MQAGLRTICTGRLHTTLYVLIMDILATSTIFATIVSLLADFKSQRQDGASDDFNEFMSWLSESRHDELKTLIQQNTKTTISIKALLNENKIVLAEKLEQLDRKLALLMSEDADFSNVVLGVRPNSKLSKQAISLLQQFENSGASKALELHSQGQLSLFLIDGGQLQHDDPRFLEDDLRTLVENKLLLLDYNSSGKRVFIYTRSASDFVKSIGKNV